MPPVPWAMGGVQHRMVQGHHHQSRKPAQILLHNLRRPQILINFLCSLSCHLEGLFLVKVGYVRATSDQPQLWDRDLPLELQTVGVEHAFSCFMPVNLKCPTDGCENMCV